MVARSRRLYTDLSIYYISLSYKYHYIDSISPLLLIYSLTYADTTLTFLRSMEAVMAIAMESVTYDPRLACSTTKGVSSSGSSV
jgi:hypothetical protein